MLLVFNQASPKRRASGTTHKSRVGARIPQISAALVKPRRRELA